MNNIFIIYHVAVMGRWRKIVKEQLELLQTSGLGAQCQAIFIQAVGVSHPTQKRQVQLLWQAYPFRDKVIFTTYRNLKDYEKPSIAQAQKIAHEHPAAKILYFHTKGASHSTITLNNDYQRPFTQAEIQALEAYRYRMEYHTLKNWQTCVELLEAYDTVGINWIADAPHAPPHFSGNFWWANASYLNRCHLNFHQYPAIANTRYVYEMFIGSGHPKYKDLSL